MFSLVWNDGRADFEVEVLVDARCAWDTPEFRQDTVVRVVLGMMG